MTDGDLNWREIAAARQDVIDEMGRCLGHPSSVARGADGAAFAGEGDQEVVAALLATRPGEAIGQNTALQVGT